MKVHDFKYKPGPLTMAGGIVTCRKIYSYASPGIML